MKRNRKAIGFLPQVPAGDLHAWKARQTWQSSLPAESNVNQVGVDLMRCQHFADTSEKGPNSHVIVKRKRSDMPVIRSVDKGSILRAESGAINPETKQQSLNQLLDDMYAGTSKKPRDALLKTWVRLHESWFGCDGDPPFPLDEVKILRVSALFKKGHYKSYKNYASRAKDFHISMGYEWTESLNRTIQKCSRAVLRGLAGPSRSEPFDFPEAVSFLESHTIDTVDGGPQHPLALIVCATYFMLRELEVSAIDRGDVTLHGQQITLALPVSKTDWEAKGCKRTWACICDRQLPCPFHILKAHCDLLDRHQVDLDSPLFPDSRGGYCSKLGAVECIRMVAEASGMAIKDPAGNFLISGHTFRITGARYLSACGLDPITIQLLGRWGTNAVLTYLSESPLTSMSQRIKPLEKCRLNPNIQLSASEISELDSRVKALETLNEYKADVRSFVQIVDKIRQIESEISEQSHIVDGLSIVVQEGAFTEQKQVLNSKSCVTHKSLISLTRSPHTWKTFCGWFYAGKRHAHTIAINAPSPDNYKPCPKCSLPNSHVGTSDSSSCSSTSSDD